MNDLKQGELARAKAHTFIRTTEQLNYTLSKDIVRNRDVGLPHEILPNDIVLILSDVITIDDHDDKTHVYLAMCIDRNHIGYIWNHLLERL